MVRRRRGEAGAVAVEVAFTLPLYLALVGMCFYVTIACWMHMYADLHYFLNFHKTTTVGSFTNDTQSFASLHSHNVYDPAVLPGVHLHGVEGLVVNMPSTAVGMEAGGWRSTYTMPGWMGALSAMTSSIGTDTLSSQGFTYVTGGVVAFIPRP